MRKYHGFSLKCLAIVGMVLAVYFSPAICRRANAQEATADLTPLKKVQVTIDEIVKIVGDYPGESNAKVRREKLRVLIEPVFDFEEMSKRSLGTYWKEATEEEQKEFSEVFSDLLARTYLSKIETVKPGMVKVNSEEVEAPKAIVKTSIKGERDTFPIDYKLQNTSGKWRVYDVVIENIGLVANYRNEFAGIIRKDTIAGLIQKLKDKKEAK